MAPSVVEAIAEASPPEPGGPACPQAHGAFGSICGPDAACAIDKEELFPAGDIIHKWKHTAVI